MNKYKVSLIFIVMLVSSVFAVITMYFYGSWQHNRYWEGTIERVNIISSSIYIDLLSTDIYSIYANKDFDRLKQIFKPLENKLLVRLTDTNGEILFENRKDNYGLGPLLQETEVQSGIEKFTIQIFSYRPPTWHSVYSGWFSNFSRWFSIKYDFITTPAIFFFLIWTLFFTAAIWRHKANIENDRLFHVLREFKAITDEKELE